jgi:hypothetical protein
MLNPVVHKVTISLCKVLVDKKLPSVPESKISAVCEEASGPDTDVCCLGLTPYLVVTIRYVVLFAKCVAALHSQGVPRNPLSSTELSSLLPPSPAGVVLKLPLCI